MERGDGAPKQLPLLPADYMAPDEDPVGVSLGVVGGDPDAQWDSVMGLFSRLAVRAYLSAREEESPPAA